jgi:hypothetical protein
MKSLIVATLSFLVAVNVALSQTATPAGESKTGSKASAPLAKSEEKKAEKNAAPEDKAGDCESRAVGKNGKKLAGAAKNAFMKKCEKSTPTATASNPAANNTRTKQRMKMASCNKEAGEKKLSGNERKQFMSDCLTKG